MKTAEEEINELLGKYNFDLAVLKDINYRLSCCRESICQTAITISKESNHHGICD